MPPLITENSHFLQSGAQEAALVMGCPCLSMLNYRKDQCMYDKTVVLNALTALE